MEKKLEVKNLQVSFRTQGGIVKAVRDISFDLYKGETLAIVGESGSGKSVTSKAIIGILAGNSIVEGGEILYDGQDLLKIDEERFHKIRGDKISMIFQDPLSSLNPIIRIGAQMTEAMILNGKSRQKNATKDFNNYLKVLKENINEVKPEDSKSTEEQCLTFDNFCIASLSIELAYNEAQNEAISLKSVVENLLFLIEKNQKIDYPKELKVINKSFVKTFNKYVVNQEEGLAIQAELLETKKLGKKVEPTQVSNVLTKVLNALNTGIETKAPNFFRLGYYTLNNPEASYDHLNVEQLDEMTKKYLDDNFMNAFIELSAVGIENAFAKSMQAKKEILANKEVYLQYFAQEAIDKKEAYQHANNLSDAIEAAINPLDIHKKSVEYSFKSTIIHDLNTYYKGLVNNPKNQSRYERQLVKYNTLVEAGKQPTWQVTPPHIIDLSLSRKNIIRTLEYLFESYEKDIATMAEFDAKKATIELIDTFKELASRAVYKVTYGLAKARSLELLKEVGIPEPAIRFKQYPFEFSGGMRQRIVIAIALSANPDILICDEPTTALDVTIQSQILELINKIKKERNLSVIFITHDLGVVANMADRIAVMYAGKIVEYGTSEDIFYDPRHPYTWALLSSMPDLETKEKLDAIPGTPPNMIYPPKGDAFAERNKYAMKIDFEEQPPLFKVNDTHFAATWLLHEYAPKVNPPKIITDRIARMKKEAEENGK